MILPHCGKETWWDAGIADRGDRLGSRSGTPGRRLALSGSAPSPEPVPRPHVRRPTRNRPSCRRHELLPPV